MIVVPLLVGGEVIGTLNLARMGGDEAHFSRDELELVQLFAGQASIALAERGGPRGGPVGPSTTRSPASATTARSSSSSARSRRASSRSAS